MRIGQIARDADIPSRTPDSLIVASNRGPFEHKRDVDGRMRRHPTGGGVATALTSLLARNELAWVAGAVSSADRELAGRGLRQIPMENGHRLRFAIADSESYDLFYGTFSNPILWFLQHSMWDFLGERADLKSDIVNSWGNGYVPVNQAFAEAVSDEIERARGVPRVMLHDYHLYLAPLFIRHRHPGALLQHFIHIPWPEPQIWQALPLPIIQSICEGLLANDSVSFQTEEFKRNFILTCLTYLPGATADVAGSRIDYDGHSVDVFANPISVDVFGLRLQLADPVIQSYQRALSEGAGDLLTIVRVDRLDPSKNVLGGFQAYDLLLKRHPQWRGRVRFLAFLVPTRDLIPEYAQYRDDVLALIAGIDRRYGSKRWKPISLYHEQNRLQALAGLSLYDVLLANSIADGMNLVVKEGPVLNQRDGALVLSKTVGAYEEFSEAAFGVDPYDIEGTAEALHEALLLSAEERRERAIFLRRRIAKHDINRWLEVQIAAFQRREAIAGLSPSDDSGPDNLQGPGLRLAGLTP